MNPTNQPETAAAGGYLRDVSLETVDHVEALKLSLFLEKKPKLTRAQTDEQCLALIWLLSKCVDEDEIARRVADGSAWEAIRAFRRDPHALWALPDLVPAVVKVKDILSRNHFLAAAEAAVADGAEGDA